MRQLQQLWIEEDGVLSFEWTIICAVIVFGIVAGLAAARDVVIDELGDMAEAVISIDQSYMFTGLPQFGIPGSDATAVLMAALVLHGVAPGRELMTTGLPLVFALIWSVFLSNWVTSLLGLALLPLAPFPPAVLAYPAGLLLLGLGYSAGIFVVPLQVFLQARPPADRKGRMIGTMNLANWIAILLAAGFYGLCSKLFTLPAAAPGEGVRSNISWTFAVMAVLILPVAVTFRPPDERLE